MYVYKFIRTYIICAYIYIYYTAESYAEKVCDGGWGSMYDVVGGVFWKWFISTDAEDIMNPTGNALRPAKHPVRWIKYKSSLLWFAYYNSLRGAISNRALMNIELYLFSIASRRGRFCEFPCWHAPIAIGVKHIISQLIKFSNDHVLSLSLIIITVVIISLIL